MPAPTGRITARRQFALTLLLGAAGAGLALLAVRQSWARAVYQAPHPLPAQSVTISGQDLVPAAGALALAGLACLAAVIATRGWVRRAAGVMLALCGAGAAAALSGSLTTASVLSAAAAKASSAASVASGGAGSTTGAATTVGGAVVTGGSSAHAVLLGVPWRVAVLAGALAIIASGLLTVWRGARWPVMSARYERPGGAAGAAGTAAQRPSAAEGVAGPGLWDSISRGDDPTEAGPGDGRQATPGPDATVGRGAGRGPGQAGADRAAGGHAAG